MVKIDNTNIAKILAFTVVAAGIAVALGWVFDTDMLKSPLPRVSMKFSTAMEGGKW